MADSFTSELAERLLRRGTRPVGVIDVRPAQERYERGAAWPRQHLATLDRAAARHQTDASPGQDQRRLLAARSLDAAAPLRDLMSGAAVLDPPRSPQTPAYSPASLARIAARQRSGTADAPAAPSAASTTASRDDGRSRGPARGETIVGRAMRAVSRSSADLPLPSRSTHRADRGNQGEQSSSRGGGDGTAATRTARDTTMPSESAPVAATDPAAGSTPARPSVVRASDPGPAAIDPPHVLVQRRHAAPPERMSPASIQKPTVAQSIVPEVVSERAHAASDLSLARARRPTTAIESPARPAALDLNVAVRPAAGAALPASALAVAAPVSAPAALPDREPALSLHRAVRAVPSHRQSDTARTPTAAPTAATERASTDPAPLQLVWRRGTPHDTHGSSAATAAGSVHGGSGSGATGQPASAAAWSSSSTVAAADAAAAMAGSAGATREGGGGMDLEQIAEEVMRRLNELMIIERERGGDPWL
jgi:hypothetical protein